MDLKSVLTGKETLEFYWALVIEPGWVQAGIWNTKEGKANVVSIGPSAAWQTDDELTSACDTALSAAIQSLPEDAGEPNKTVFGVSSAWVSEGQISQEFLDKIKKICSSLSLTPVGFVVISEAIAYYIKSDEGSPLNAIVIGMGAENVEISVFKLGNFSGTQIVSRSVSIADDITEGLSRFSFGEDLPSRILLYDGKEGQLDEARQALMKAEWEAFEKIKFLHTPKIEILIPDKKVLAVALAGGAEIASVTKVEMPVEPKEEKQEILNTEEVENIKPTSAEALGFVVNKDIEKEETKTRELPGTDSVGEMNKSPITGVENQTVTVGIIPGIRTKILNLFKNLKLSANSALEKFGSSKKYDISESGKRYAGKRMIFMGLGAFLLIFIAGFVCWWYFPKATVTIYVSPQNLEGRETVFIDPEIGSMNFEDKILPGEFINQKEEGEKTASATGTKTVGEKAKGEVTLYRSGKEITLSEGTKLGGPGGLEYTLDNDVTIASGSASSPGTTNAGVTAVDIGAQYNLAAGETFSVSNYPKSELEAKNESSFSGGSSRDISAISESDREDLKEDLLKELEEKAVGEIENSLSDDKYFIKESVSTDILDETFSGKVGDEASTLKLELSVEVKGLMVEKNSLLNFAKEVLKSKVAQGYVLRDDQVEVEFELADENKGVYELDANFKANLLPEINTDKIVKEISGKYPSIAKDYLSSIQGFSKVEFNMNPDLPGRLGTLPRLPKNITIEISAD